MATAELLESGVKADVDSTAKTAHYAPIRRSTLAFKSCGFMLQIAVMVGILVTFVIVNFEVLFGCASRETVEVLPSSYRHMFLDEEDEGTYRSELLTSFGPSCSPNTRNATAISYHSKHRFYTMLQHKARLFPPPVIKRKSHQYLCNETAGYHDLGWSYCLPVSGRKDQPFCSAPDRMDLLMKQDPTTLCYGSVLHMLLIDVYEEIKALGGKPAVLYGTLLGAIRDGPTIPFTEDSDIGYQIPPDTYDMQTLKDTLWQKGYFLHLDGVWRVCIAPTHPLASNLYNPRKKAKAGSWAVPYVDLYHMEPEANGTRWRIDEAKHGRRVPQDKFAPYTQVRMNGLEFDTLADPKDFLVAEYGEDYMVPTPRKPIPTTP